MRKISYLNDEVINDSAINFGRGLFETILIKDKAVFLKSHIRRLNDGIKKIALGEEVDIKLVEKFIEDNNIKNKALKIIVTEKNMIFSVRDIRYTEDNYKRGNKVVFSKVLRNTTSNIVTLKTINYLDNILEYEKVLDLGYDEAIFLNELGFIAEGCTTNIFIIKDKVISTPTINDGILPGIVREKIIENFNVIEKNITKEELLNADEVFLTNSLVGVIKVSTIEDKNFNFDIIDKIRIRYEEIISGGKDE